MGILSPVLSRAIGQVLRPIRPGQGISNGRPWTPAKWFQSSEQGIWYASSDMPTMSQDYAGTTPVTAVEQPDGLILDKRLGLVRGPELIGNGTFDTDASGWAAFNTATQTVVAGRLRVTAGPSAGGGSAYTFPVSPNNTYEVRVTMQAGTGSRARVGIFAGGGFLNPQTTESHGTGETVLTFIFKTNGHTSADFLVLPSTYSTHGAPGDYADFDNISVRELPGNHASQSTAAARPVLKLDGTVYNLKLDGVDDGFGTTFPAGTLGSNMDCFMLVRRDSAASAVLVMENPPNTDRFFAVIAEGKGSGVEAHSSEMSSNTNLRYFVDGVQVGTGPDTTRGELAAAMPVGQWCVLEVHNLNLASWATLRFGNYGGGFSVNGAYAEVILAPAQSAEERTKAREYLAAQAGITLP